jgi:hypothetical protein
MNALQMISVSLVNALLFVWLCQKVKTLFVSSNFSITRETEMGGENVVLQGNAYIWEDQEAVFKRINFLGESAMDRKAFPLGSLSAGPAR